VVPNLATELVDAGQRIHGRNAITSHQSLILESWNRRICAFSLDVTA
jgi:hypothetical protein